MVAIRRLIHGCRVYGMPLHTHVHVCVCVHVYAVCVYSMYMYMYMQVHVYGHTCELCQHFCRMFENLSHLSAV